MFFLNTRDKNLQKKVIIKKMTLKEDAKKLKYVENYFFEELHKFIPIEL